MVSHLPARCHNKANELETKKKMNSPQSTIEQETNQKLEQRIRSLERQNLFFLLTMLLFLIGLFFLMAQRSGYPPRRAACFELAGADHAKKTAGLWTRSANGAVLLRFYDQQQQSRLELGLDEQGRPGMIWRDAKGRIRAGISGDQQGTPRMNLLDANGISRCSVFLLPNGSPGLVLRDAKGTQRAALMVLQDGSPALELAGEKGRSRVIVSADKKGTSALQLRDQAGRNRIVLEVDPAGRAQLRTLDAKGLNRCTWPPWGRASAAKKQ